MKNHKTKNFSDWDKIFATDKDNNMYNMKNSFRCYWNNKKYQAHRKKAGKKKFKRLNEHLGSF